MKYWKITTSVPGVINALRRIFEDEVYVDGIQLPRQTYESNIPYVLRFMIDTDIVGMGWMKINNYRIVRR
jgi:DNA polymerase delta subunit 1